MNIFLADPGAALQANSPPTSTILAKNVTVGSLTLLPTLTILLSFSLTPAIASGSSCNFSVGRNQAVSLKMFRAFNLHRFFLHGISAGGALYP